MSVVMRLCGGPLGQRTPYDGQFLQAFDFEAAEGQGLITMTRELESAMRFADIGEAMAFYRRSPECKPLRPDGQPNRPLTATNWSFERIPDNDSQGPGDCPVQHQ